MKYDSPALTELRQKLADVDVLMRRGILTDADTGRDYFTGYSYKTLYDWDQYFEAIVQIYMGWPPDYIFNAVRIFLDHQLPSGHIVRSVPGNEWHDPEHVKPFLCQILNLGRDCYGEPEWIAEPEYYARLKRYIDYWLVEMDTTQSGLSEWMSAPHTGMDNQHERAGWWKDRFSKGVDLNCYLVRELRAFAALATSLERTEDAAETTQKADALADRIRTRMWNEEEGFFFDLDLRTGKQIPVKAVSGFAPLWAKVATPEQAERLVHEHLFNAAEFWTPQAVATISKSQPGYSRELLPKDLGCNWRACVWIPTNYMLYHGLRYYGYNQLGSILARTTHRLVEKSGNREWYDSETGEGCGLDPFWGWSLLGHFLPFEETAPFDITDL